jgi:hypothetical protein
MLSCSVDTCAHLTGIASRYGSASDSKSSMLERLLSPKRSRPQKATYFEGRNGVHLGEQTQAALRCSVVRDSKIRSVTAVKMQGRALHSLPRGSKQLQGSLEAVFSKGALSSKDGKGKSACVKRALAYCHPSTRKRPEI